MLMLNPEDEGNLANIHLQLKNSCVFENCLPPHLLAQLQASNASFSFVFKPADHPHFGLLTSRYLADKLQFPRSEKNVVGYVTIYGDALSTQILTADLSQYRDYFDTLAANHGITRENIPEDFKIRFEYPIPNSDEKLALMHVGTPKALLEEYLSRFPNNTPDAMAYLAASLTGEYALNWKGEKVDFPEKYKHLVLFLHAHCDEKFFADLQLCIEPLLQQIHDTKAPEAEKQDAMTTIYWLLAQSTPVVRGGSAYARVILEHVAYCLRSQGHDCDIPYTKEGVDLWAEAVTTHLDVFKAKFKDDVFFDPDAKTEDVARYFERMLAAKYPSFQSTDSLGGKRGDAAAAAQAHK
jgi:hypothetical protein